MAIATPAPRNTSKLTGNDQFWPTVMRRVPRIVPHRALYILQE
ncbi:MAG: hypothetical protein P8172_04460 [Gammaproteobacteria bacterium]